MTTAKDTGVLYIMTTAIRGLVKIGKTGRSNYAGRMRELSANGYFNVTGLKPFLAVEVADYHRKEKLVHRIFSKHQLSTSEIFALELDLAEELLLSFGGTVISSRGKDLPLPPEQKPAATKPAPRPATPAPGPPTETAARKRPSQFFSFAGKGLSPGDEICYVGDPSIRATILDDKKVSYQDQPYTLSGLVVLLKERDGTVNKSRSYQGPIYWTYRGTVLTNLPDVELT